MIRDENTNELVFVPGKMIMDGKNGPRFLPGQVIESEDGDERFIPGQIMDSPVDGIKRFVPGTFKGNLERSEAERSRCGAKHFKYANMNYLVKKLDKFHEMWQMRTFFPKL